MGVDILYVNKYFLNLVLQSKITKQHKISDYNCLFNNDQFLFI
jgi:hypothetical protein